jgi:hypothetical protein
MSTILTYRGPLPSHPAVSSPQFSNGSIKRFLIATFFRFLLNQRLFQNLSVYYQSDKVAGGQLLCVANQKNLKRLSGNY